MFAIDTAAPPVGILGTVLGQNAEQSLFYRNRVATYLFFCLAATAVNHGARVCVPYLAKRFPLRVKFSHGDVLQLVAIWLISYFLYSSCYDNGLHPRFKEDFLQAHRLTFTLLAHAVYTVMYFVGMRLLAFLPDGQAPAQAANVVRIGVKTGLFAYWCLSGECFTLMATHPLELTSEQYWSSGVVAFGINTLYTWELLFRDLRPVNVIHHAIACMGFVSMMEFANVLEPTRVITAMPFVGSLIETFVCMGSVAYRFMPRGKLLARLMLAITVFVLVSYNLLLLGYVSVLYGYIHLYSFFYGYIGMPCLVLFTYPAQMNMAKVFYSLYKKASREEKPVVSIVEQQTVSNEVVRRRKIE
ncbi:hypothetical protein DIPPA_29823 [Diplonema papillatum]|nr:hypothetical protein DIPPA_29823 [Diplonema papillatum]|eukprot:gene8499-13123_t